MQKVRYRFKNFNSLLTISFRSFHLYKSFFHLSLTVLIHYRSPIIFSIEGGTPMFRQKTALLLVLQNLNLQGQEPYNQAGTGWGRFLPQLTKNLGIPSQFCGIFLWGKKLGIGIFEGGSRWGVAKRVILGCPKARKQLQKRFFHVLCKPRLSKILESCLSLSLHFFVVTISIDDLLPPHRGISMALLGGAHRRRSACH